MIRTSHYDWCDNRDTYLRGAKDKDFGGEMGKGEKIGEQSHIIDTEKVIRAEPINSGLSHVRLVVNIVSGVQPHY